MNSGQLMVLGISLIRSIVWFAGSYIVLYYGRQVSRLIIPSWCIGIGMILSGFNSLLFTFSLNSGIWTPPDTIQNISLILATPTLVLIVGGIVYSMLNAWHLQRNSERLGKELDSELDDSEGDCYSSSNGKRASEHVGAED